MFLLKNKIILSILRISVAHRDLPISSSCPTKTSQKVHKSSFCPNVCFNIGVVCHYNQCLMACGIRKEDI
jgi:hypothetical protein